MIIKLNDCRVAVFEANERRWIKVSDMGEALGYKKRYNFAAAWRDTLPECMSREVITRGNDRLLRGMSCRATLFFLTRRHTEHSHIMAMELYEYLEAGFDLPHNGMTWDMVEDSVQIIRRTRRKMGLKAV